MSRISRISDKRIELFTRTIKERLGDRLIRVVLFGSRARGDAQNDSDYDCLIIVREMNSGVKELVDDAAGEALLQTGAVISAFPITERLAESMPFSPLLMSARNEGVEI